MENEKKETNVKATIDAITGLAKAIPVYNDAIQPAAKEIGKSLATVTKTVNIALAPIKAIVWGYDKIEDYLTKRIAEKLKDTPEIDISTPPAYIAGPAVEAMRYTAHNNDLRELFANLLANSMKKDTQQKSHPGFVEVLKNLTPEEAKLLEIFLVKNVFPKIDIQRELPNNGHITVFNNFTLFHEQVKGLNVNLVPTYIDNFSRLGLIEVVHDTFLTASNIYEPLENSQAIANMKQSITSMNQKVTFKRGIIRLTSFGKDFIDIVVK